MYVGKTLFAQVMEFVPWTSFARIVHRYSGNAGARTLSCADQFLAMAFAQLTGRESLRDIQNCLSALNGGEALSLPAFAPRFCAARWPMPTTGAGPGNCGPITLRR